MKKADIVFTIKRRQLHKIGIVALILILALVIHQGIYLLFFWTTPIVSLKNGFIPNDTEIVLIEQVLREENAIYYKSLNYEDSYFIYAVVNWQYDKIAPKIISLLDMNRWDYYEKIPYSFKFWYFL